MTKLLLAAFALCFSPLCALAEPQAPAPGGGEQARKFHESLMKERDERIKIREAETKEIDAIRNDPSLTPAQKQAKIKPIREAARARLRETHKKQLEENKGAREALRAARKAPKL